MPTTTITPNTQLCISIAARPGRYGITVHNAAFTALGLDYVYKACAVHDLAGAVAGIRALGIRGAAVSMPFKQDVMALLDRVEPRARAIGAVNTIVNDAGVLTGYNTDVIAVEAALARVAFEPDEPVLLLGAGGVARAVRQALLERGARDVRVASRTLARTQDFVAGTAFRALSWEARADEPAAVLVNATPIGMAPDVHGCPVEDAAIERVRAVIEIVATPAETRLAREASTRHKQISAGPSFSLDQAAAQLELYTGEPAPLDVMRDALARM